VSHGATGHVVEVDVRGNSNFDSEDGPHDLNRLMVGRVEKFFRQQLRSRSLYYCENSNPRKLGGAGAPAPLPACGKQGSYGPQPAGNWALSR